MTIDYMKNREYFKERSISAGIVLIVLGVIAIIIGFLLTPNYYSRDAGLVILIIGFILLILGILIIFLIHGKTIPDNVYDAAVNAEIEERKQMAMERLNIEYEQVNIIQPIFLHQFTTDKIKMPVLYKIGNDDKIRTSNIECMAMFFSEHQIYCYYEQFSMTSHENFIETNEYFYSDIDSIKFNKSNVSMSATEEKNGKYAKKLSDINSFLSLWEKFTICSFGGTEYNLITKRYVSKSNQLSKYKNEKEREKAFVHNAMLAENEIMEIDKILRGVVNLWRLKKQEN